MKEDILQEIENLEEKSNQKEDYIPFYDIQWDTSGKENSIRKIKVNLYKLVNLLKKMGYRRFDVGSQSFIVRIIDNVVEECTKDDVIDTFEEYIMSFPDNMPDGVMKEALLAKLYAGLGTYFSDQLLNRLVNDTPITFNKHTQNEAFFYYKNGYVKVSAEKVELLPYSTLDKMIWKSQVLDREFKAVKPSTYNKGNFTKFVGNIADNYINEKTKKPNDPARFESFKTIIGYLLHSYFEGKLKAVILTDSRISEEASGRSGKTLLLKALGYLLNTHPDASTFIEINGKDFDLSDRFKYQELKLDTRLVHINDVQRKFDFQQLFNDITEGISCQKKNAAPFRVMAKLALSTNLTIRIHGDSAKDRSIEFELADYYGADFSPEKEFKQWFFRDWDKSEWAKFDNFLLECVRIYLEKGIVMPGHINLLTRKLQEETCIEFLKFMEDLKIKDQQEFDRGAIHNQFKIMNPDFSKLTRRRFTEWLRTYAKFHEDYEDYLERRSNNIDYIKFFKKDVGNQIDFWENTE